MDIWIDSLTYTTRLLVKMGSVMFISLFGVELLMQLGAMRRLGAFGKAGDSARAASRRKCRHLSGEHRLPGSGQHHERPVSPGRQNLRSRAGAERSAQHGAAPFQGGVDLSFSHHPSPAGIEAAPDLCGRLLAGGPPETGLCDHLGPIVIRFRYMVNLLDDRLATYFQAIVAFLMVPATRFRGTLPRYTAIFGVRYGPFICLLILGLSLLTWAIILVLVLIFYQ